MKCALHVHTNLSDASISPQAAVDLYADHGFGAIAITDHEFLLRDDYVRSILNLNPKGMIVMAGVEIDYEPWSYQHLLRIMGEKQTLHVMAHPSAYFLELHEIKARVAGAPFPINALELSHRGFYTPKYDDPLLLLPKIATDDAHAPSDVGRAWIETDPFSRADLLLRAIIAGDFKACFFRGKKRSSG